MELNVLSNHGERPKQEIVDIVREDSINNCDSVQVREFGLAGSPPGQGSPGERRNREFTVIRETHLHPLKSKGAYHGLHTMYHLMGLLGDLNAAFP